MLDVLSQMATLIACGAVWRVLRPNGLDPDTSRSVLTTLVYYLLLPALVLDVMWRTEISADSLRIALVAAGSIVITAPLAWVLFRLLLRQPKPVVGALVLASVFPNVTYLGLPVLESLFGPWGGSVAIQFDLFACTPLLLSAGILFAEAHGDGPRHPQHPLLTLAKVPALWAALGGALLSVYAVPMPPWLGDWLGLLRPGVVPLMLIALGMGLRWERSAWQSLPLTLPVLLLQLLWMPFMALHLAKGLGMQGNLLISVVLEAAMPSMVLGIVLCDRYRLHSGLYATATTVSTLVSLFTLPLWFRWTGG